MEPDGSSPHLQKPAISCKFDLLYLRHDQERRKNRLLESRKIRKIMGISQRCVVLLPNCSVTVQYRNVVLLPNSSVKVQYHNVVLLPNCSVTVQHHNVVLLPNSSVTVQYHNVVLLPNRASQKTAKDIIVINFKYQCILHYRLNSH